MRNAFKFNINIADILQFYIPFYEKDSEIFKIAPCDIQYNNTTIILISNNVTV